MWIICVVAAHRRSRPWPPHPAPSWSNSLCESMPRSSSEGNLYRLVHPFFHDIFLSILDTTLLPFILSFNLYRLVQPFHSLFYPSFVSFSIRCKFLVSLRPSLPISLFRPFVFLFSNFMQPVLWCVDVHEICPKFITTIFFDLIIDSLLYLSHLTFIGLMYPLVLLHHARLSSTIALSWLL